VTVAAAPRSEVDAQRGIAPRHGDAISWPNPTQLALDEEVGAVGERKRPKVDRRRDRRIACHG
jgi:hypothetical protein